jgi:hypothetical protein
VKKLSSIVFDVTLSRVEFGTRGTIEEWDEVRTLLNGKNILSKFRVDKQSRCGMDSSLFFAQEKQLINGNVLLGICGCKDTGCSDLLANIHSFEDYVMWDVYVSWYPSEFDTFFFDKKEYRKAIKDAKSKCAHKIEDAYKWAWMLGSSKTKLAESLNKMKPTNDNIVYS